RDTSGGKADERNNKEKKERERGQQENRQEGKTQKLKKAVLSSFLQTNDRRPPAPESQGRPHRYKRPTPRKT
ncbi:hypothetical protein, partial [Listeria monocytogenes]|uniref:hypothetical protein n=1 Tax=Listeria monocytogenes TaxID=1639 RepID=UPI001C9BE4E1